MKKIFSIIALTVLVWGCAKKITPSASVGTASSNTGTTTSPAPATLPVLPAAKTDATTTTSNPAANTAAKTGAIPADPAKAKSPDVMGQTTYNAKCGRCHGLKVTTNYTADRWVSIMQVMAPKAQLTDAEKENVLVYVKTNAKK
jgi:PBP1b-binding outer membrane lipoprotein LpoB